MIAQDLQQHFVHGAGFNALADDHDEHDHERKKRQHRHSGHREGEGLRLGTHDVAQGGENSRVGGRAGSARHAVGHGGHTNKSGCWLLITSYWRCLSKNYLPRFRVTEYYRCQPAGMWQAPLAVRQCRLRLMFLSWSANLLGMTKPLQWAD